VTGSNVALLLAHRSATSRRLPYRGLAKPTERCRACNERLIARDAWNFEELRLLSCLTRHGFEPGVVCIDEDALHEILAELLGVSPTPDAVAATMRLGTRGRSQHMDVGQLHYALRFQLAHKNLPVFVQRTLATANVGVRGVFDTNQVHALLERLNGEIVVRMAEAKTVLYEAALAAEGGQPRRAEVVGAIAAWYLHVERRRTKTSALFNRELAQWRLERRDFVNILHRSGNERQSVTAARPRRGDSSPTVWQPDYLDRELEPGPKPAVAELLQAGVVLLPVLFFAWLLCVAARHGDYRCPHDLDGLMAWFAVLGLATIAVDVVGTCGKQASPVGIALKAALLVLPWLGMCLSSGIGEADRDLCGPFIVGVGLLLWNSLVVLQVLAVGFFARGMFMAHKHERYVQHVLATLGSSVT